MEKQIKMKPNKSDYQKQIKKKKIGAQQVRQLEVDKNGKLDKNGTQQFTQLIVDKNESIEN